MKIGDKIKYLRVKNGYTQKELAEKVGVAQNTISSYEKGIKAVSIEMIEKFAEVFNERKSYFVDDPEQEEPKSVSADTMLYILMKRLREEGFTSNIDNLDKKTIDKILLAFMDDYDYFSKKN